MAGAAHHLRGRPAGAGSSEGRQNPRRQKFAPAALATRRSGCAGHARRERRAEHGLLRDHRGHLRDRLLCAVHLLTFFMAFVVQEMTVRLGAATHRGHAELIFQRFGPFWGYFAMGDLVFGNLLTLVTEFIAIQAGGLYFGLPSWLSVAIGVACVIGSLAFRRYATWERVLMGLAVFNLLFIPAALLAHPDGAALTRALATWQPVPDFNTGFLTLVLATVGATVTPWMIFFQQSAVVDKGLTRADVPQGRMDTAIGAILAAVAAIATLVAAAPLFAAKTDVSQFANGADFATALAPLIGSTGATLFALGILEAGLVAAAGLRRDRDPDCHLRVHSRIAHTALRGPRRSK
jgi:Mn2+/Fe2+ NRAMP family transporter